MLFKKIKRRINWELLPTFWKFEKFYSFLADHGRVHLSLQKETNQGPGIFHRIFELNQANEQFVVNALEVNLNHPGICIEAVLANGQLNHRTYLRDMMQQNGGDLAINASFYNRQNNLITGLLIMGQRLLLAPSEHHVCIGFTRENQVRLAYLNFEGHCINAQQKTLQINGLNHDIIEAGDIILYTSHWGDTLPQLPENYRTLLISFSGEVLAINPEKGVCKENHQQLVGPENLLKEFIQPGEKIEMKLTTQPDWSDVTSAISGGPFLLKNGHVHIEAKQNHLRRDSLHYEALRSALGVTAQNRLILATISDVKRRRAQHLSSGVTLKTTALIMKQLGCATAVNLDGGRSSQMMIQDKHLTISELCEEAKLPNALIIRAAHDPEQPQ